MKKMMLLLTFILTISCFGNFSILAASSSDGCIEIINDVADLKLENNEFLLNFNNKKVLVKNYDFYYYDGGNVNDSFYIADVLDEKSFSNDIVYFYIYYNVQTSSFNIANIQILDQIGNKLLNLKVNLNRSAVRKITSSSLSYESILDLDLKERLRASSCFYGNIKNEIYEYQKQNIHQENIIQPMFNNIGPNLNFEQITGVGGGICGLGDLPDIKTNDFCTVDGVDYNSYTDSDGIIKEYESRYFGEYINSNGLVTDDPIVKIIPKELFYTYGKHIYIGREYGFLVHTYECNLNYDDNISDVVVFDIENVIPNLECARFEGKLRIKHLFEHRYLAIDREKRDNYWVGYDPDLTRVVFPNTNPNLPKFCIKNIAFRHTVENLVDLNYGDPGYNPNEDPGCFFIQSRLNYQMTGQEIDNTVEYLKDTIKFAFGNFFDEYGIISYMASLFEHEAGYETFETNNEENIKTLATNAYYQIQNYGNLYKQLNVSPKENKTDGLKLCKGDYLENYYVVSCANAQPPTRFCNSIRIEIGALESNPFIGNRIYEKYAEYSSYESSCKTATFSENKETNNKLNNTSEEAYYYFVPIFNARYNIQITSFSNIELFLYNSNYEILEGDYNNDIIDVKRISINLVQGEKYIFRLVRNDNIGTGEYKFLITYDTYNAEELGLNEPVSVSIGVGEVKLYKYVTSFSGEFTFRTIENDSDPVITIYDNNFTQIGFDDDGGENRNCIACCTLNSLTEYYILVKNYGNNSGSFKLVVDN